MPMALRYRSVYSRTPKPPQGRIQVPLRGVPVANVEDSVSFEQEEWLRVTRSSVGEAIVATDRTGSVAFMNPAAQARI